MLWHSHICIIYSWDEDTISQNHQRDLSQPTMNTASPERMFLFQIQALSYQNRTISKTPQTNQLDSSYAKSEGCKKAHNINNACDWSKFPDDIRPTKPSSDTYNNEKLRQDGEKVSDNDAVFKIKMATKAENVSSQRQSNMPILTIPRIRVRNDVYLCNTKSVTQTSAYVRSSK